MCTYVHGRVNSNDGIRTYLPSLYSLGKSWEKFLNIKLKTGTVLQLSIKEDKYMRHTEVHADLLDKQENKLTSYPFLKKGTRDSNLGKAFRVTKRLRKKWEISFSRIENFCVVLSIRIWTTSQGSPKGSLNSLEKKKFCSSQIDTLKSSLPIKSPWNTTPLAPSGSVIAFVFNAVFTLKALAIVSMLINSEGEPPLHTS